MNIKARFAIDHNKNRKIEPEEVMRSFSELEALDQDDDKALTGRELDQVYLEYGEDTWLVGNRRHYLESGGFRQQVELRGIELDPPRIDLHVKL